jgi:uncharacterized protein GlcG (DUF336 family)
MAELTLEKASIIVDAALAHAKTLNLNPLTVAVLDAGGHLIAFKRQDTAGILRPNIAFGKAWGTLGMGLGGRSLAQRSEMAPAFYNALVGASDGRVIPVPGGVLIRGIAGDVIGAVGISGDMPDKDEACAVSGIDAADLTADVGGAH